MTRQEEFGLEFERVYTEEGVHPYETVEWTKRDVKVTSSEGETIFEQNNVEFPKSWTQNATQIVTSKYFHGQLGSEERESSLKELISRVVLTITEWGRDGGYFASDKDADIFSDELTAIALNQHGAFNSPVWFNCGCEEEPQCSACFINSVEDNMDSILDLAKTEGMIFKHGSGSGVNLSSLRAEGEKLSSGGTSSGPISFMRGYDAFAGSIKSGGKTRRAAKMVLMDDWHPDVLKFIDTKMDEEKKAWALIDAGYDGSFTGEAYNSVYFQNANHSVRVSDQFMQAVLDDRDWNLRAVTTGEVWETIKAKDMLDRVSEATHLCGDPGLQFTDQINRWHTCKNSGPINASNPCSEYVFLDNTACNLASINLMKYRNEDGTFKVDEFMHTVDILIAAQEIIVGNAYYPIKEIEKNSHIYRTLGLGFTNLGALLMSLGFPYDSDEGRNYAAAIASLMTGRAYYQSSKVAANLGPFDGFEKNREPMLEVMNMHRDAARQLLDEGVDDGLFDHAVEIWDKVITSGKEYGYRNAQASVIAPTGCLVENTLVPTDKGLMRIGTIGNPNGDQWQDVSFKVQTDEGPQQATQYYVNGVAPTRKIITSSGYEIQGTYKHQIKVVNSETKEWEWKHMMDIQPGDIVPIAFGEKMGSPNPIKLPPLGDLHWNADYSTEVPKYVDSNLSELVGYYMGDGSLHAKGLRFCVTDGDDEVLHRLNYLSKTLFNLETIEKQEEGYVEVSIHSVPLTIWWEACGFSKMKPSKDHKGKGYSPYIPNAILETNDLEIYGAFLRGLYEADGTIITSVPSFSSANEQFVKEVRSLLLMLGLPTSTKIDQPYGSHLGENDVYSLRLKNKSYNLVFQEKVGFISSRKGNQVDCEISERSQRYDHIYLSDDAIEETVPIGHTDRKNVLQSLRRNDAIPRSQVERIFEETGHEDLEHKLGFFYDVIEENIDGGEQFTYDLSVPENVTYIANGFVSHNTISFMMDADTTGIEPDISLIKYKKLVGGGYMKIVNQSIKLALQRLEYSDDEIDEIVEFIDEHGHVEGVPHLDTKYYPIFDTSITSDGSDRSIHHMAHITMMGAVQPFISGAISKTVNMPEHSTIEDINAAYIRAWELGLKAVAIYRDNSKRLQPLNTKDESSESKKVEDLDELKDEIDAEAAKYEMYREGPVRRRLEDTRDSKTHKFEVDGHEGYITVGTYPDGSPGEVFIKMSKQGSTLGGVMDSLAVLISISLQYGVPLSVLVRKFIHTKFEPAGMTINPKIPIASSIIDYLFRWLALEFLPENERPDVLDYSDMNDEPEETSFKPTNRRTPNETPKQVLGDNRICSQCGAIAVRSGSCYACPECGTTSGCS